MDSLINSTDPISVIGGILLVVMIAVFAVSEIGIRSAIYKENRKNNDKRN